MTVELEAGGDYLEIRTAGGGGGYGDPMQRDPEAVRRDLENGLITESYAKKHYGWSK